MLAALLVSTLLAQAYYTPAEAKELFDQANDSYNRAEYGQAKELYRRLLERGWGGADVLFNLGTTHLAAGELGEGVLYLERARRAGGLAEDVEANLAVARSKQLDQVIGDRVDEPFIQRVAAATPDSWVAWAFLLSWCCGWGLLLARRLVGRRTVLGVGAATSLMIAVGSGSLLVAHVYVRRTVIEGVVLAPELKVRELPKESGKVAFEVHAGLKVRLEEESGAYQKVRLPNGLVGWAEREGVGAL